MYVNRTNSVVSFIASKCMGVHHLSHTETRVLGVCGAVILSLGQVLAM